ncbi:tetratricopeptide repeat protein [Gluconacetobacter azotocaptans]|nr:tetratricopeptide repeat protein [Gluconacetobacter azotocaptans]
MNIALWKDTVLRSPTPENLVQLCSTLFSTGQELAAVRLALEVVSSHPDDLPLTTAAAGVISKHTARHDIVATLLRSVLLRVPHIVSMQAFLAYTLIAGDDLTGGIALFSEMMARHPGERTSLCEYISTSLLNAGYPLEALEILDLWLKDGEITVWLLNNMGCALVRLGRSAEALPWYERALTMAPDNPEIAFSYALTLLKAGKFRDGFARYVDRAPMTNGQVGWFMSLPRLRHGDDVAGRKIILYQEQGLGDTIQFIRSVPYLLEQGAEVTIAVPAGLVRLLAQSFPDVSVRSIAELGQEDGYSYAAPIPDLPFIAGVMSESDIPARIPYLRADADDIARFAAMLPARRPRIGLVWAGDRRVKSEHVAADKRRSTTLAEMGAALCPVDATLVNLQFGPPRAEIEAWQGQPLFDPMGDVRDMADTAALMESLDLIISVDTSPVHLAGAIGRPVWLVNRWDACWRWGDEGDSSPWYPATRVFRAREKSFGPVLREVGEALHKWVETWKAG